MAAYATGSEADAYFNTRLHSSAWFGALIADQNKSLEMATRQIDRLSYRGAKNDAAQALEFPRTIDSVIQAAVPEDIKIATYEIALALLDGRDIDIEFEQLSVSSQGYSSVRKSAKGGEPPVHLAAGIPSFTAWQRLLPYLRDNNNLKTVRSS